MNKLLLLLLMLAMVLVVGCVETFKVRNVGDKLCRSQGLEFQWENSDRDVLDFYCVKVPEPSRYSGNILDYYLGVGNYSE